MGKNKKEIAKRRARAQQKKKTKRPKPVKLESKPTVEYMERPPLSELGAPKGFRSISISQALIEYAKPLFDYAKGSDRDMNEVFGVGNMLWNYTIAIERGDEDKELKNDILKLIKKVFVLNDKEAAALINKMIERRSYLFPPDIQPAAPLFMFIRKETATIIKPFDYSTLVITDDIVSPDEDDEDLIDDIHELDEYMENSDDYDEFEDLLYSIVDESKERFSKWLVDKGLSEHAETFPDCIELYLNFIYGYSHRSIITLESMPPIYLSEFFEDFLIRKMMVENPNEYVLWGPAIKLFYRFLFEKGYIDSDSIVKEIDRIEPAFIKILKKQFT